MCDIGMAVALTSVGLQAYGEYTAQESANKALDYNAQVVDKNIELVDIQKEKTEAIGKFQEVSTFQAAEETTAAARATFAGSGFVAGGQGFSTIAKFNRNEAMADVLAIRSATDEQIRGLNIERESLKAKRSSLLTQKVEPWKAGLLSLGKSAGNYAIKSFGGNK